MKVIVRQIRRQGKCHRMSCPALVYFITSAKILQNHLAMSIVDEISFTVCELHVVSQSLLCLKKIVGYSHQQMRESQHLTRICFGCKHDILRFVIVLFRLNFQDVNIPRGINVVGQVYPFKCSIEFFLFFLGWWM